jgi:hypothetical protein
MSRLTLRLPNSLHQQLEQMAENEQISLNQYIVYALTRQLTMQASFDETQQALAARETVEPEPGLTPEVVGSLRAKIAARKKK